MSTNNSKWSMRVIHRYLGFFLAGVMAIYAISGMVLVFRNTDFLKKEKTFERILDPNMPVAALGKEIGQKRLKIDRSEGDIQYFKDGQYNQRTGAVNYTTKELPFFLDKMTKMHKATTNSTLYFFNLFFGASLLFFVVSSFWMFRPTTDVFKKGLYFTLGGIVLALIMLFV